MGKKPVWRESLRLYRANFADLCRAMLVQLALRGIALCPLMFLADASLAPLGYLALPLYLLIALPARQNYALALQDMMNGGRVFSLRLLSTRDYGKKLLRGLKTTLCLLLWSALTLAGLVGLYLMYKTEGKLIDYMALFMRLGGSVADGMLLYIGGVAASAVLIGLGCGVHSGTRHALALGDKKLLRGKRLRLLGLWFAGLLLTIPYLALVGATLSGFLLQMLNGLKSGQLDSLAIALSWEQGLTLLLGALVLLAPVLPLRSLLPAVLLRHAKEDRDAAA